QRPLDQQEVVLRVDPHHRVVARRDGLVPHAAGHAHALLGAAVEAAVRGAPADRAAVTVHALRAVAGAHAAEVVALHHALGPLALARSGDVDELDAVEDAHVHRVTRRAVGRLLEADLAVVALRTAPRLRVVPNQAERRVLGLGVLEAELDGEIAVRSVGGLHLRDDAGACLDDGNGNLSAVGVIDARHADLLTEQRWSHSKPGPEQRDAPG